MSRMKWLYPVLLLPVLLLAEPVQKKDSEAKAPTSYMSTRGYSPAFLRKALDGLGWSKYIRYAKHDGNLVVTGMVNQGQMASGYTSGGLAGMRWPKGANESSYGYVFVYYVAGEVTDSRGNLIHIVSDRFNRNSVEMSQDGSHNYHFMPLPRYYNNHHPQSADWDIGGITEDVGLDGVPNTHDSGEGDGKLQAVEDFNANGVLDLSMINQVEWFAMSHRKETWPADWPPQSYAGDWRIPGVNDHDLGPCAGKWNGEYGYYIRADQESYYIMDDHENDEFEYYPENLPGTDQPDTRPWPDGRRGLGVSVKVRNYQWNARLAEDILLSLYDVTNYGRRIDKSVIGMYCDIDIGGHGADIAQFDKIDDITYVWDGKETWRYAHEPPTGYFGYAFLESPGLPSDGLDNDEDGMVDESQYDKIDNDKDWKPWQDSNSDGQWNNEDINYNGILDPGEDSNANGILDWEPVHADVGSDGIGPDQDDWPGPDSDGTECNGVPDWGEPNFDYTDNDESDQVGLTSWYLKSVDSRMGDDEAFWHIELRPGTFETQPGYEGDMAFTYGCGYVPLESGKEGTQRYAIACLFGNDFDDILRNKRTMQKIYDSDYNFTKPPRKPNLAAMPGDGRVVLVWDNRAELSKDPIYGVDFEGYKIYKSTDPAFSDIKTICDAFNNPLLYAPVAQFDLIDGLVGPHPITLGREGGSQSDLGIAMDMGSDTGLKHFWVDTTVTNGRTYYYAVVAYDRGYDVDFYERGLSDRPNLLSISPTECSFTIQTDEIGRTISFDQNCVAAIPQEKAAGYVTPTPIAGVEHISGYGSGRIDLKVVIPTAVQSGHTYQLSFTDDGSLQPLNGVDENHYTGLTRGLRFIDRTDSDTLLTSDMDFSSAALADEIFEGLALEITNSNEVALTRAEWLNSSTNLQATMNSAGGKAVPRDYEVRILDVGADTSMGNMAVTNFQIWDVTDPSHPFRVRYRTTLNRNEPDSLKSKLSAGDDLWIYIKRSVSGTGEVSYTQRAWHLFVVMPPDAPAGTQQIVPQKGAVLRLTTNKPFDRRDVFEFTMTGNEVNAQVARTELADICVVPNPYIATSTLERKIINRDIGRGDRRIDFVHLPARCTINIYTVSGRLVRTIQHNADIDKGREIWDLRTKDGLEIASGYYFYYVDAPGIGGKKGKFAVIK